MVSRMSLQWALVIVQVAAYWPVWKWYVVRLTDASDEPWGLAALATALCSTARQQCLNEPRESDFFIPALIVIVYAVGYGFTPPLVHATIAMIGLAATLSPLRFGTKMHIPTLGLLVLSLPVMSSLQFFLGYPIRSLCAAVTAPLLQMGGLAVIRDGTCLRWGDQLVSIDAPCSGVRMLWAGMFLAMALSSFLRLSVPRTTALLAVTVIAVILGNVLRSASLFYLEAGILPAPPWCHDAVGTVVFSGLGLIVLLLALQMGNSEHEIDSSVHHSLYSRHSRAFRPV